MQKIPVFSKVQCTDGPCGQSFAVVVDPTTRQVTHFALRDESLGDPDNRLVPVKHVVDTTSELIRLSRTRAQVAGMGPFIASHYIKHQVPRFEHLYSIPYVSARMETIDAQVTKRRVPLGQLAIHRGAAVEATDGRIGTVGEFMVDPESGEVTHLVLEKGLAWSKQEVTLPVSAIDRVIADTVYLKLDKGAVGQLPSIPVRRHYVPALIAYENIDMVAILFDDAEEARETLDFVEQLHRRKAFRIRNAALLVKEQDGTASIKDTRDIDPREGRILGAITGGLIGLFAGPPGAVVGALAGAGAGSVAASQLDFGFADEFLTGLQERLQPGSAAVVVLLEHEWTASLAENLSGEKGVILQQALTDDLVEHLLDASEKEAPDRP